LRLVITPPTLLHMLETDERLSGALVRSRGLILILVQGKFTFESDGAVALFGEGGEVRAALAQIVGAALPSVDGRDTHLETALVDARGVDRWLSLQLTSVQHEGGEAMLIVGEDLTDQHVREAELRRQATTDALTGLPNRTVLADRIGQALLTAERQQSPAAVIVLDLDRFKDVNDSYGHSVGDQVLREVADRTRAQLRTSDTVARLGGDEFAILLPPPSDLLSALATARKIHAALSRPFQLGSVNASAGIAIFPAHGRTVEDLVERADIAMYTAKRAGTNIAVFDSEHDARSGDVLTQVADIGDAIDAGRLGLRYQPTVSLLDRHPLRAEALVRLAHASRGMLRPASFLPLAERAGLGPAVSAWVLRHALARCREWRAAGADAGVSINIALRDLLDHDLPTRLKHELDAAGLAASTLTVEVSERTIAKDIVRLERPLRDIAAIGVRLALDDFGSGDASLTMLQRLPLSEVKLDGRYVSNVLSNPKSWAFVRSSIDASHALGLEVTAEGVEDNATAYVLQRLGCDVAQGHYFTTAEQSTLPFLGRAELDTASLN
jgi:diguanylate cyclase (GGDEF)-like protein